MTFGKLSVAFATMFLAIIALTLCRETAAHDTPAQSSSQITSAWQGLATKFSPSLRPDSFMEKQLSDRAIENLVSVNGKSILIADFSGLRSGNPYLLCRFHREEKVKSLEITWKGNGTRPFSGNTAYTVTVYIYNNEKRQFLKILSETWKDRKAKVRDKRAHARLDRTRSYMDEQNNIYLLVVGPWGSGDSNSTLSVDYVGLTAR